MNGFKTSNAAFLATSSHLSNPLHQQMSNFPSQHCRGRLLGACATAGFHQRNLARTFTRQQGDIINMISDTLLINICVTVRLFATTILFPHLLSNSDCASSNRARCNATVTSGGGPAIQPFLFRFVLYWFGCVAAKHATQETTVSIHRRWCLIDQCLHWPTWVDFCKWCFIFNSWLQPADIIHPTHLCGSDWRRPWITSPFAGWPSKRLASTLWWEGGVQIIHPIDLFSSYLFAHPWSQAGLLGSLQALGRGRWALLVFMCQKGDCHQQFVDPWPWTSQSPSWQRVLKYGRTNEGLARKLCHTSARCPLCRAVLAYQSASQFTLWKSLINADWKFNVASHQNLSSTKFLVNKVPRSCGICETVVHLAEPVRQVAMCPPP